MGAPKSLNDILEVKVTEATTLPLPETESRSLSEAAFDKIVDFIVPGKHVLALGPGLRRHPQTERLVQRLVEEVDSPLVLDADGLNNLGSNPVELEKRTSATIMTPHWGEMARLLGITIDEVGNDQIATVRKAAADFGAVVVLKSARTLVADPEGNVYINPTGNSGMASGGSGPVNS